MIDMSEPLDSPPAVSQHGDSLPATSAVRAAPPSASRRLDLLLLFGGAALLAAILLASRFLPEGRPAHGDALIRNTVRLSLGWYAAALLVMLRLDPAGWAAATAGGRLARWCWTWGIVCFVVHLAMSFHYFHNWSQTHAIEHTRQRSGWGDGIYVSYLFTWLWIGDAAWWWARPAAYAARSVWLHGALHAFMLFIVFNGTVIFETGGIRWAGLAGFGVLVLAWFVGKR